MSLPGHRRTSSHKRRRASHFALTKPSITVDKAGRTHRMHTAAPGATEYNGVKIFVKGLDRKMERALNKTKSATVKEDAHDHEGHDHDHEGHNHGPVAKKK
ncbi:50S ribosomal protein L32 [Patescibacteria group bacterium]|jgi:ribosomal protein L32|nr:50S ribosomal protein L32 [Patescibacteria group bacterium]